MGREEDPAYLEMQIAEIVELAARSNDRGRHVVAGAPTLLLLLLMLLMMLY